jgi:aminopeptidase 2
MVWHLTLTAHRDVEDRLPIATPDVINQAQYALDIKQKALPLYEQAFDIEYPLPKLDTLVANDFDAGAMENWVNMVLFLYYRVVIIGGLQYGQGLITGRTTAYLVDPENADIAAKKRIARTQSHEVAHMWSVILSEELVGSDRIGLGLATSRQWRGGTICISMKVLPDWFQHKQPVLNVSQPGFATLARSISEHSF